MKIIPTSLAATVLSYGASLTATEFPDLYVNESCFEQSKNQVLVEKFRNEIEEKKHEIYHISYDLKLIIEELFNNKEIIDPEDSGFVKATWTKSF